MKTKEQHYFFLNPYKEYVFTRCPKCETKTKIKKFCLLIHIEPRHLLALNKTVRFCPYCDLIIVKKEELEQLLCVDCEKRFPEIIGNDYFVLGTMERKDWKKGLQEKVYSKDAIDHTHLFKNIWSFEVEHGGWVYDPKQDKLNTKKVKKCCGK